MTETQSQTLLAIAIDAMHMLKHYNRYRMLPHQDYITSQYISVADELTTIISEITGEDVTAKRVIPINIDPIPWPNETD